MNLHNVQNLTKEEQKTLVKKITPFVEGTTSTTVDNVKVGSKTISGCFSGPSNTFSITQVKAEEEKPQTELYKLIESGVVVKNNNWYTYNNKNYNGIAKITAAINS